MQHTGQEPQAERGAETRPAPVLRQLMLGEALDRAGYVVLVADYWMRYLEVSAGACALLGYTREELLGLSVQDVVVESRADERYEAMVDNGGQRGQVTLRTKLGAHVRAQYDARQTTVGGMTYFVSLLTPLSRARVPGD